MLAGSGDSSGAGPHDDSIPPTAASSGRHQKPRGDDAGPKSSGGGADGSRSFSLIISGSREEDTSIIVVDDGDKAELASRILCQAAAQSSRSSGLQMGALMGDAAEASWGHPSVRARFISVSTGMRLRYLEYGTGDEVVVLLHDLCLSADIWDVVGRELASDGYRVLAVDMRGHGSSSKSSSGAYSPSAMAADIEAMILELDLYVKPIAVIGVGLGAAVGLALAHRAPRLVAALMVMELCLGEGSRSRQGSLDLLSFHPAQALSVAGSPEVALEVLCTEIWCSPRRRTDEAAKCLPAMMARNPDGSYSTRMDTKWFFIYKTEDLLAALRGLTCPVALAAGQNSHLVTREDLEALVSELKGHPDGPAAVTVTILRGLDHNIVSGNSQKVYDCIADFLASAAPYLSRERTEDRRPEELGLRPLPQFRSIEEAKKALGPRSIPSAAAVEAELRRLAMDEDGSEGGSPAQLLDGQRPSGSPTALAKDSSDYFGFVG